MYEFWFWFVNDIEKNIDIKSKDDLNGKGSFLIL